MLERWTSGSEFTGFHPCYAVNVSRLQMWHIVYLSYESPPNGRDYIGKHSTPDLNDGYFGSFKDKEFNPDSRVILGYYKTAKAAVAAEIQWQRVFQVAVDPQYANRAYQTSVGFVCIGHTEESKQKMRDAPRTINPDSLRTALGKSWFYNPETGEETLAETCPHGFKPGRPSMVASNPGKNPSTETKNKMSNAQRARPPESQYWTGREGNAAGTHWWRNPITGETKRSNTQPGPAWVKGRK